MYGFIFGFHRLARCPKCTPASIRSLTASATKRHPFPRENSGPRSRDREPRATVLGGFESFNDETLSYRRDAPSSNPSDATARAEEASGTVARHPREGEVARVDRCPISPFEDR